MRPSVNTAATSNSARGSPAAAACRKSAGPIFSGGISNVVPAAGAPTGAASGAIAEGSIAAVSVLASEAVAGVSVSVARGAVVASVGAENVLGIDGIGLLVNAGLIPPIAPVVLPLSGMTR